jgi:uncharacterized membrane protein YhdT
VVALIALLLLVGIALRGYLPGETRDTNDQPTNNPAAMIAVLTLLIAATAIITIAIVAALRQPRTRRPDARQLRDSPAGDGQRPTWRFVMIVLVVLLAWLVCVVLLLRLSGRIEFGRPPGTTAPSTPTPSTTPAAPPSPPSEPKDTDGDVIWPLFATTVVMLLLWAAGIVVALRRGRRTPQPQRVDGFQPPSQPPGAQPLAVAAELGLAEMGDLSREPREAIIACYAAMEAALANAPEAVPQDSDTPSEVLARAIEHHAIHGASAGELVGLFAEARFSPHVMNEQHREAAVRALEAVLAELRSVV